MCLELLRHLPYCVQNVAKCSRKLKTIIISLLSLNGLTEHLLCHCSDIKHAIITGCSTPLTDHTCLCLKEA